MKSIDDVDREKIRIINNDNDNITLQRKRITIKFNDIIEIAYIYDDTFFFLFDVSRHITNIKKLNEIDCVVYFILFYSCNLSKVLSTTFLFLWFNEYILADLTSTSILKLMNIHFFFEMFTIILLFMKKFWYSSIKAIRKLTVFEKS